ncbi:MAG: hypothetical protein LZF60_360027 [Nitrospira sp.]|nr:MAG: hypothetical protein LZF60_360027 [Nitrospira sp.]
MLSIAWTHANHRAASSVHYREGRRQDHPALDHPITGRGLGHANSGSLKEELPRNSLGII